MMRWRTAIVGFALLATPILASPEGRAAQVTYTVSVEYAQITLGATSYTCHTLDYDGCANLTITATGDTSTIQPFLVSGAHGFINVLQSASFFAAVYQSATATYIPLSGNFITPVPFVAAVDNANFGVGFDTPGVSPTYPAAIYGVPGLDTYDLASDFTNS